MPYSPDTGLSLRPGHDPHERVLARTRASTRTGQRYTNGTQAPPIGSPLSGTFTAIDGTTNKIAWQHKMPYRMGGGGGSTVTAGGLLLRGEPDGNFVALDAKTGEVLWKFQTGFGADAPAMVYEVDGDQYIAIATGGNSIQGSAYGDAVWAFSLKGQLGPLWPPPPPQTVAGPGGAIADGVDKVKIGDNNVEYAYWPARTRVKAGNHRDLHQCRRHSAHGDRLRQGQGRRLGHRRSGQGRSRRKSPSRNRALISTSARRTRGCTARSSSNSVPAYRAGGRASRMPSNGAAASGDSFA